MGIFATKRPAVDAVKVLSHREFSNDHSTLCEMTIFSPIEMLILNKSISSLPFT
jgi:hypothetical protein